MEAAKKRKNIRQKGGKTCSATFVATKDDPQKRTADKRAIYVSSVCLSAFICIKTLRDDEHNDKI